MHYISTVFCASHTQQQSPSQSQCVYIKHCDVFLFPEPGDTINIPEANWIEWHSIFLLLNRSTWLSKKRLLKMHTSTSVKLIFRGG